jgi:hypothetical protein
MMTDEMSSLLEARDTLTQMLQRKELGAEVSAQIEHVLEIIEKDIQQGKNSEGR